MEQSKMKVCYVVTERNDKSFWTRIGVAFTNRDGSLNVKLDAVPVSGTLQIRDYEPRDESDAVSLGPGGARRRPITPADGIADRPFE